MFSIFKLNKKCIENYKYIGMETNQKTSKLYFIKMYKTMVILFENY